MFAAFLGVRAAVRSMIEQRARNKESKRKIEQFEKEHPAGGEDKVDPVS